MKKFNTKAFRKKLYLQVANRVQNNMLRNNYLCNELQYILEDAKLDMGVTSKTFPEFFLFKDFHNLAWLSHESDWGVKTIPEVNENKLTVLYLCAEMCG